MPSTNRFREKQKEVEARLFDGDTEDMMAVVTWIQSKGYIWFDLFTPAPSRGVSIDPATGFLSLVNSKGELAAAQKGDWVLSLPDGDMKPMKANEFEATYQEIVEP